MTGALGPEDGEDLVGVRQPGLDEPRLLWLAASQFGHRAQHEEPVERFLMAVLFDVLQRGLAPELISPASSGGEWVKPSPRIRPLSTSVTGCSRDDAESYQHT